jgi:hypothetical protein
MAEPQVAPTLQSFQPRSGSKRLRKATVGPIATVEKEDIQIPHDVAETSADLRPGGSGRVSAKGLRLQDGIQVTVATIPPESPKMKALLELLFPSDGGVAGA